MFGGLRIYPTQGTAGTHGGQVQHNSSMFYSTNDTIARNDAV